MSARLETFLNRKSIRYELIPHDSMPGFDAAISGLGVAGNQVVRTTLLIDVRGVVMAVHPYHTAVDIDAVSEQMGRRFQFLTARQTDQLFSDCDPGFHPPLGAAYGLPVVVDENVLEMTKAYITAGADNAMLQLDGRALRLALAGADKGKFCLTEHGVEPMVADRQEISLEEVARRLEKLYRLPPMPALALRILRLTGDNQATAGELAALIENDPSMTAQVMRYARSALFNYPGQISSVQEAVTRVLGFDRVAHVAMGIASVRAFDIPRSGALGMDAFWRHSLYCAWLCQQMAAHPGAGSRQVDKGLAYLCGLLHNFGLLLIGHLFPEEFDQLNLLREANPEQSMRTLETRVFGASQEMLAVGHGAIGGILHRLWQLPDEVVKSAGVHQQSGYQGDHATYVKMVQLANGLLGLRGIGDEFNEEDLQPLADSLGFTEADLEYFTRITDDAAEELDTLAQHLG